jgi:hypothetical protein
MVLITDIFRFVGIALAELEGVSGHEALSFSGEEATAAVRQW